MPPNNLGPDTVGADRKKKHMVLFHRVGPYPSVYLNGEVTNTRAEVYYTGVSLKQSGSLPETENPAELLKVWTPVGLKTMEPNPSTIKYYDACENYKQAMEDSNPTHRIAGLYVELRRGQPDHYRVVMTGPDYSTEVNTPQALKELLGQGGDKENVPPRLTIHFNPGDIRFQKNRNYSTWQRPERLGVTAKRKQMGNQYMKRVYARYTLTTRYDPQSTRFRPKLAIEIIIIPSEEAGNGLNDQQLHEFDSSGLKVITIWTSPHIYEWHQYYANIPRVFSVKNPIPACGEKHPETDIKPSEYVMRRIAHDLHLRSRSGADIRKLKEMEEYIKNPEREYIHSNHPPLIMPEIPNTTLSTEHPAAENPDMWEDTEDENDDNTETEKPPDTQPGADKAGAVKS